MTIGLGMTPNDTNRPNKGEMGKNTTTQGVMTMMVVTKTKVVIGTKGTKIPKGTITNKGVMGTKAIITKGIIGTKGKTMEGETNGEVIGTIINQGETHKFPTNQEGNPVFLLGVHHPKTITKTHLHPKSPPLMRCWKK